MHDGVGVGAIVGARQSANCCLLPKSVAYTIRLATSVSATFASDSPHSQASTAISLALKQPSNRRAKPIGRFLPVAVKYRSDHPGVRKPIGGDCKFARLKSGKAALDEWC